MRRFLELAVRNLAPLGVWFNFLFFRVSCAVACGQEDNQDKNNSEAVHLIAVSVGADSIPADGSATYLRRISSNKLEPKFAQPFDGRTRNLLPPLARAHISLRRPRFFWRQDYNDGSAPFPYATECAATAAAATCDPDTLVAEMDISGSAEPVVLDIPATADASDAVELVGWRLLFVGCFSLSLLSFLLRTRHTVVMVSRQEGRRDSYRTNRGAFFFLSIALERDT